MRNESAEALDNLRACASDAPSGTYDDAKAVVSLLDETMEGFMRSLRDMGMKADNCDSAHELESALYAYVRASNPQAYFLMTAEGFGSAMSGPARDRVIRQAASNLYTLQMLGVVPVAARIEGSK